MTKKFTDYDMRKFVINDTKDVYAFFDAMKKGMDQTERLMKKLAMSNAAQASVIRSFEKVHNREFLPAETQEETTQSIIQSLDIQDTERAKDDVLARMKAVDSPEPVQDAPQAPSSDEDGSEPIPDTEEALETVTEPVPFVPEGNVVSEPTAAQDEGVVPEVKPNRYRGYEKKTFSNGQSRYFRDGGAMVAAKDVPAEIKEVLDGASK